MIFEQGWKDSNVLYTWTRMERFERIGFTTILRKNWVHYYLTIQSSRLFIYRLCIHQNIHIHIYTGVYIYIYIEIYMCIQTYIHTIPYHTIHYIHTYHNIPYHTIHTDIQTYRHTHIHTYILTLHYITLPYITLHYHTYIHYITFHYITLHYHT